MPSIKQWLFSLPLADTHQLLNPPQGTQTNLYRKLTLDHITKDSWILSDGDFARAEAELSGKLIFSLAFLKEKDLDCSKDAQALVELKIKQGKKIFTQQIIRSALSELGEGWREYQIPLPQANQKKLEIELYFKLLPSCSKVYLALANSRLSPSLQKRKNLIIISIDTLRADHLSLYGYFRKTSPNLDRFAQNCLVFTRVISASSFTSPSVASLFTSLYPSEHQTLGKDQLIFPSENLTLAEILEQNGYLTAGFSASPFISPEYGFAQGFEHFQFIPEPRANLVNEKFLSWLSSHYQEQPFFLYIMYFDPHQPYDPPAPFDRKFQKDPQGNLLWKDKMLRNKPVRIMKLSPKISPQELEFVKSQYDGEIAFVDHHLGILLDQLKQKGLLKNSIIIITSDHGEEFLEHNGFGHSRTLYQEVLKVPLIIYLPEPEFEPKPINQLVRTIDILPTILDLLGIKIPDKIQGKSLMGLIKGTEQSPEPWAFAELKPFLKPKTYLKAIENQNYKLILNLPSQKLELYNLASDLKEKNNLINILPDKAQELLEMMERVEKSFRPIKKPQVKAPVSAEEILKSLGYIR